MVLATNVLITDIVLKEEDYPSSMQFPMMVNVPVTRNCIPPNVTLAAKSTVLDMVNRSETIGRKEINYASKRRLKRNGSFWHLNCVLLVGILINPAFGLAAALILSLEKSNEEKLTQNQNRRGRRIGIGLLITGIIVSLWTWSAVFIYHYALYSVETKHAQQLTFVRNQVQVKSLLSLGSPIHPTTQDLPLGSDHLHTVGQFENTDTVTRTLSTPNAVVPRSHGTVSPKTSKLGALSSTNIMPTDVTLSTDPPATYTPEKSSLSMLSSTRKPFTEQIHPITSTRFQRQSMVQKSPKVAERFRTISTVPPTKKVEETSASKSEDEAFDEFLVVMTRFASAKTIKGL